MIHLILDTAQHGWVPVEHLGPLKIKVCPLLVFLAQLLSPSRFVNPFPLHDSIQKGVNSKAVRSVSVRCLLTGQLRETSDGGMFLNGAAFFVSATGSGYRRRHGGV